MRKTTGASKLVLYRRLRKKGSVGREQPFKEDLSAEAEKSSMLEAVTRERLVKT
jgi:hypothetical protein